MTTPHEAIDRLADVLAGLGDLADERWRRAMHAVPRHLFLPERGYALPSSYGKEEAPAPAHAIDRSADPDDWWAMAYSDMAIVTQRDDGAVDPASNQGHPTSSISAPGVVFRFLELLAPVKGERILDIGTGTGWTAALLSDRVGAENVTSIEIDPQVAAQAAENLQAAGYAPTLIVGDGAEGWPSGAPYDGIHVTCGVREIPYVWVQQLQPGGRAVVPWMSGMKGYQLLLKATGDGRAVGTFHGAAGYMLMRSQRSVWAWAKHHVDDAEVTTTSLDPVLVMDAVDGADLALIMKVPNLSMIPMVTDDGERSCFLAESDNPRGSWATCDHSPTGAHTVTQYGDRRLWDEAEAAYLQWTRQRSPGPDAFRLTVDSDGQRLTLIQPAR